MNPSVARGESRFTRGFGLARRQKEDSRDHDRGWIVELLSWTPEQRLEANARFLRLYASVCPEGSLIRDDD